MFKFSSMCPLIKATLSSQFIHQIIQFVKLNNSVQINLKWIAVAKTRSCHTGTKSGNCNAVTRVTPGPCKTANLITGNNHGSPVFGNWTANTCPKTEWNSLSLFFPFAQDSGGGRIRFFSLWLSVLDILSQSSRNTLVQKHFNTNNMLDDWSSLANCNAIRI